MKKVLVLIPMYGKAEYTKRCIDLTIQNAGIDDYDILVVDDGSEERFTSDEAITMRLEENTGFTNAVNQGILWAGEMYEYIHLLNNDTEPEPNFIKVLLDAMEEQEVIGIAGSARILEKEGHKIELFGADLIRGYQVCTDGNVPEKIIYTRWVPLCSALIRVSMIREIGILDKRMKIWCSDNDFCIRANFAGYNVALLLDSKVKHAHAVTTIDGQKSGKWSVEADQRVLIEKMAGMQYAELMKEMPLDAENKIYGKITFETYKK